MDYYSKFLELYQSANFPILLGEDPETGVKTITLIVQDNDNVIGYWGFTTILWFDKNGEFLRQEIWE